MPVQEGVRDGRASLISFGFHQKDTCFSLPSLLSSSSSSSSSSAAYDQSIYCVFKLLLSDYIGSFHLIQSTLNPLSLFIQSNLISLQLGGHLVLSAIKRGFNFAVKVYWLFSVDLEGQKPIQNQILFGASFIS